MSGKLVKMVIEAYEKPDFTGKAGQFTFQINPENYSRVFKPASCGKGQVLTNGETVPKNFSIDLEDLTLTFFLDSSGVVAGCDDVQKSVEQLKDLCLDVNGKIHRANYLKVRWSTSFVFPCVMKSLTVDYLLFKPDGAPVRAKLTANFQEFVDAETKAKQDNTNSPDLTHVHTVVEGDNLPLICYRIYGDCQYYLQVAEFNQIANLSDLTPGQKVVFPPLSYAKLSAN